MNIVNFEYVQDLIENGYCNFIKDKVLGNYVEVVLQDTFMYDLRVYHIPRNQYPI